MSGDYLWDGSGHPDPEIKRLERLLGRFRYREQEGRGQPRWFSRRYAPLALAASLLIAFGIWRLAIHSPAPSWEVRTLAGTPTIDAEQIGDRDQLKVGGWLETDAESRVRIFVDEFGEVDVEPNTRIGLVNAGPENLRLSLARGSVHAVVSALPQQFVIETPSARAVDLGSDYVLLVDDGGGAVLCVSSGWVSLETDDRRSIVPAGAVCETRPGIGPGTPRCDNAPDAFRYALERFDFVDSGPEAISAVLSESGPCDLIPLWHVLRRVDASERGSVYDRMTAFGSPPAEVTRDGILGLDGAMMQYWWGNIKSHRTCLLCADQNDPTKS
jgi:hypothetical protein